MFIELPETTAILRISPYLEGGLSDGATAGVEWHIAALNGQGRELYRSEGIPCPSRAGAELHALWVSAGSCGLIYHDAIDRVMDGGAEGFGDRLAEVLWDAIDRDTHIPDDPEHYAPLADGHPIDALRFAFLEAASII